jgi:hypothetical protein
VLETRLRLDTGPEEQTVKPNRDMYRIQAAPGPKERLGGKEISSKVVAHGFSVMSPRMSRLGRSKVGVHQRNGDDCDKNALPFAGWSGHLDLRKSFLQPVGVKRSKRGKHPSASESSQR